MRKTIFCTMLAFIIATSLVAQNDGERRKSNAQNEKTRFEQMQEEIRIEKAEYFSRELRLTSEEAKNFWPIYNRYTEEEKAIRDKYRVKGTSEKDFPVRPDFLKMSAQEAKQALDNHMKEEREINSLNENYSTEFQKALPIQKVLKLFFVERVFMANFIGKRWKDAKRDMPPKQNGVPQEEMNMPQMD